MFKKNNLNIGIGLGILLPMVIFGILSSTFHLLNVPLKTRTIGLICICLNILTMQRFKNFRANESIRGTVLATVALCAVWLFYYGQEIYEEW